MKKNPEYTSLSVTNFTRGIIYLMATAVLAVCGILLPELAREERVSNPNAGPALPFLIGAWILALPVIAALYETLKILNNIDKNTAFSNLTVKSIQKIKIYSIAFSLMIVVSVVSIIVIGKNIDPTEDFAPVASFGFIFTFAATVIATFASVLERLLQDALNMKEENDLTV